MVEFIDMKCECQLKNLRFNPRGNILIEVIFLSLNEFFKYM